MDTNARHELLITLLAEENASAFTHLCASVLSHGASESDKVQPEYALGL